MSDQPLAQPPFPDLPEGTVTFLFTDIEGSTQLLQRLRDQYAALLSDQRRLLRQAFAHWNGREVDTQGDAFFVAFPRATQAVAAAVEAQRLLAEHLWPDGVVVRVRMGIHTGEPWKAEEGYVGIDVHRAARIAHIGHGGQVLLSETATALVLDELPQGVTLLDLGRHLLKDIHRPERIRQLVIEGLPVEFPPLTSLEALPAEAARQLRQVGGCPYRGLSAFQEADARFYFGREAFVTLLLQAVTTRSMVAVIVGSSGSGKSSALFAGLLPRLRAEQGWQMAVFRPGSQPFYSLAGALIPLLEPGLSENERLVETRILAENLRKADAGLYQVVERIIQKCPAACQILLVVDQFEELYTLCPDVDLQRRFIDELLAAVQAESGRRHAPLVLLLTMRADFMGQALAHRPFADALQEASLLMGPMTRDELRVAIEKPAELQGAAFEPGLVERLLDDVGQEPGNLPLLEFALTLLWERQNDGWLTHTDYEALGCVDGALACYADLVYTGLQPDEQERARRALVQLVRPGEGTEDTRRLATRAELGAESWELIQHLADQRLVVTGWDAAGVETAEVVHEALIQKWGRFREWMAADRAFRSWQERLRDQLRQWQESGQDEGALLRGVPLAVAQNWLGERSDYLSQAEVEYIHESQALQARQHAELERRRRTIIFALAGGLLLALLLSVFAISQRQNALQQRENALRQSAVLLASQSESELANGYHDRAVLLALEALEKYPYNPQAEHALGQAVSYTRAIGQYISHQSAVTSLAWSPDGRRVASSSSLDNDVHIWDPATDKTIRVIEMPKSITGNKLDMALNVQWTPDGKRLLVITGDRYTTGSQDYDLLQWDASSGALISSVEIANHSEPEMGDLTASITNYPTGAAAEIAPLSGQLATLGGDNTALVWDAVWQKPKMFLSGHTKSVNSVDWSPDETRLVTASLDGTARVWDAQTGKGLYILEGHKGSVSLALWSPDGISLATAGEDGTIRLWNAANGKLILSIDSNASAVSSLVWSPNSLRVASGHRDGSVRIWDVASGKLLETLHGHQGIISDLKWSPTDDRLVSADGTGNVRIWNAAASTAWRLYPPQASQGGDWTEVGDWSSDGRYMVMAGGDTVGFTQPPSFGIWDVQANKLIRENLGKTLNFMPWMPPDFSPDDKAILYLGIRGWPDVSGAASAYIFDANNGQIIRTLTPGGETFIRAIAWSRDGSQVATGLSDNQIIIWNIRTGNQIARLVHGMDESMMIDHVEWSPDGSRIASTSDDSTIRIWDARTWEPILTLQHQKPTFVWHGTWSPDGTRLLTTSGNEEQGAKDSTARIWDTTTGKELLVIRGHNRTVFTGSWSPDGKRIATSGNDGTVRVWDAATGAELLTLSVPVAYGLYTSWSPDGKHLTIMGWSTLVSVWRVWQSKEELIEYAKGCCVIRQLTPQERQQFGLQ